MEKTGYELLLDSNGASVQVIGTSVQDAIRVKTTGYEFKRRGMSCLRVRVGTICTSFNTIADVHYSMNILRNGMCYQPVKQVLTYNKLR